jgi:hypothetical protein
MSTPASKLRLGPLPKADLDRYAALHTQTWGEPVDSATLAPHMLEAFMARDRGFRKASTTSTS